MTLADGGTYDRRMDELDRLLARVKERAQGWMPLPVYRRLYETAAQRREGPIVEIGTFRGAATLALALGAGDAGGDSTVITADILRPGVGAPGATIEDRKAALRATFEEFGAAGRISFVHGTARELVAETDPRGIALLLLDGGGKIEADLALLWDRLAPGCIIVIDDIDGAVRVRRSGRTALVDQKHRLSRLLADRFVEAGLLAPLGETCSTGWYEKGGAAADSASIERRALPASQQLVKAEIDSAEFGPARGWLRRLARSAPALARAWRRIKPAR